MTKAFTLVELAIVLTVIGLLIGGVLKGQEMIENARMTTSAARVKALSAAAITFRDIYDALPGDMREPARFLPGCTTAPCNASGDGNGEIASTGAWDAEASRSWLHLAKAGLISGVDAGAAYAPTTYFFPDALPDFPIGGDITIFFLWFVLEASVLHRRTDIGRHRIWLAAGDPAGCKI